MRSATGAQDRDSFLDPGPVFSNSENSGPLRTSGSFVYRATTSNPMKKQKHARWRRMAHFHKGVCPACDEAFSRQRARNWTAGFKASLA